MRAQEMKKTKEKEEENPELNRETRETDEREKETGKLEPEPVAAGITTDETADKLDAVDGSDGSKTLESDAIRDEILKRTGGEKPVEKPAEQTPTEKPIEDDLKDLPEGITESGKQAIIRERVKARKERETWEKEKAELVKNRSANPETSNIPSRAGSSGDQHPTLNSQQRERPAIDAKGIGLVLEQRTKAARVLEGYPVSGMTEEMAKETMRLADIVLNGLDSEGMVLEVIDQAQAGRLGENGAAIAAMAKEHLPLVAARARNREERARNEEMQQKARVEAVAKNISAQVDRFPELKDSKSAESLFAEKWIREQVGTMQQPGPLAGLGYEDGKNVRWLYDAMMNAFRADQYVKVAAERDMFKKRVERGSQPIGEVPAPTGGDGKNLTGSAAILQQLKDLNPGMIA
jgi:hypothetical protein